MCNFKMNSKGLAFENFFVQQSSFHIFRFDPNRGYANQWRLFFGNVTGMFSILRGSNMRLVFFYPTRLFNFYL